MIDICFWSMDEGWKVVDKWLERRNIEAPEGSNVYKPEDITVFLLEKEDEQDEQDEQQ